MWAYRNGAYLVESFWQRNEHLLKEFARDLFAPIEELLLSTADSKHQTMLRDFVNMAALCDPTIPVKQIVATLALSGDRADEFLDQIDDLLGAESQAPVFNDYGFSNPGFPNEELVYGFRNPVLPGVILKHCSNAAELATRLLGQLSHRLRPESRAVARLYMSLAEVAGSLREAQQYANQLCWWTSIDDTERLKASAIESMKNGDVSSELLWIVVEKSRDL